VLLKKSLFNIKVDELDDGRVLLFNSITTNFGIVNKDVWAFYQENEIIEQEDISDFDMKKHIQTMKDYWFLIEEGIHEKDYLKISQRLVRYSNQELFLTIAPTLDCNMACPYCYEKKTKSTMSQAVILGIVSFVKNQIKHHNVRGLNIVWYGGEPLLELETIIKLSKLIVELCENEGIRYSSGIITNGSLLTYESAKILKDNCNVSFAQVTIDGLMETHNKRRILINGEDSFGIITSNIEKCKELFDITIRVNVDKKNIDEVGPLIKYLYKEKDWSRFIKIDINPVDNLSEGKRGNPVNCFTTKDFAKLNSKFLRALYENANNKSLPYLYPKRRLISCSALHSGSFVIDPDGNLYKCWNLIGLKEHSFGSIFTEPVLNKELATWLSIDQPKACENCNLLPLCQGGCPLTWLQNDNVPACSHKALSFKENLKITYEKYVENL
jgi:uncharacterized protein